MALDIMISNLLHTLDGGSSRLIIHMNQVGRISHKSDGWIHQQFQIADDDHALYQL